MEYFFKKPITDIRKKILWILKMSGVVKKSEKKSTEKSQKESQRNSWCGFPGGTPEETPWETLGGVPGKILEKYMDKNPDKLLNICWNNYRVWLDDSWFPGNFGFFPTICRRFGPAIRPSSRPATQIKRIHNLVQLSRVEKGHAVWFTFDSFVPIGLGKSYAGVWILLTVEATIQTGW